MCCYFLWFYDFHLSPRILVSLAGLEIDRDTVWHLHCVCNEALTINFMNWMSYQPSLCFWRSLHGLETSFHRVGNSTSTSPSTLLNVLRLLPFTFIPISPFSIFQPLSTYRASLLSFTPPLRPVSQPNIHSHLPSLAMFGPFPSCLVAPADEPCSPSKSPGRSSVRRSLDTSVKSPVTEARHPAPDPGPPPIKPGNAFSIIARREWEKGRVREKSFGKY